MTTTQQQQLIELSPSEFATQINAPNTVVFDVRERGEYTREHIARAENIPLSTLTAETVPQTTKNVILYCQSGNRSRKAADLFFKAGYYQVTHLDGGFTAWRSAALPYIEDKKAPLPMMRQVQIVAGGLVLTGTLLSAFVSPWFLLLTGFVGSGLMFAGFTGFCGMAKILARLPYNQVQ
jgi:rhodanese-related sulfurtransferase